MKTLDRAVLYVGLLLAVILAAVGIVYVREIAFKIDGGTLKVLTTNPQVINIEQQKAATSLNCYADVAWVSVTSSTDKFSWTNTLGVPVNITFSTKAISTKAIRDDSNQPVLLPIPLKPGETKGLYHIDSGAVSDCPTNGPCYLQWDITYNNGTSCEDHQNNYYTGIQITR